MGLFIMLNNFLHDFAVAILFACLLVLSFEQQVINTYGVEMRSFFQGLFKRMNKLITFAWVFIIAGGIIRTMAYMDYEWVEAVGKGQIAALVVKHILLITFVVWGSWLQLKLRREIRSWGEAPV